MPALWMERFRFGRTAKDLLSSFHGTGGDADGRAR